MASWTINSKPITTESEVTVTDDSGRTGRVGVRWVKDAPQVFGPVVSRARKFDSEGVEVGEPETTVLDANPTFN